MHHGIPGEDNVGSVIKNDIFAKCISVSALLKKMVAQNAVRTYVADIFN